MKTLPIQKTRWCAWAAAALLLGAANIAQAGWVPGSPVPAGSSITTYNGSEAVSVSLSWTGYNNASRTKSTSALAFKTDLGTPVTVGPVSSTTTYDVFTSYCVDLATTVTNPAPAQAGLFTGTYADSNLDTRNIGAAAWVLNTHYSFADILFDGLSLIQKQAALQIAIWQVAYSATVNSVGDVAVEAAVTEIYNDWVFQSTSNGSPLQQIGFLVDYKPNGVNFTGNNSQDQLAAYTGPQEIPGVPIPAALFFVAPALLGVLGGMRRKPQGMVA
jgi:hypothetical protein